MAVTSKNYGPAVEKAFKGEIDFDSDTIKCSLHLVGYTPDQDHAYFSETSNEVTGTGYTAGGATLASCAATYSAGSNLLKLDANDPTWTTSTLTAVRTAVVYDSTPGTAATNPLIAYFQSDTDISTTAGTFTVTFAAAGISTYTAS
jgi:hypothetical protein